jgi:hypothetical protein
VGCELGGSLHRGEIPPLALQKVRLAHAFYSADTMNSSLTFIWISANVLAPPNDLGGWFGRSRTIPAEKGRRRA